MDLLTSSAKNLSDVYPDLPDNNYGYSVQYLDPPLPAIACMMLCVFAMRELALRNFESEFNATTWAMYSYPDVKISFTPASRATSTVRWALWSLAAAIRDMIIHDRFQSAQFNTHYSTVPTGILRFVPSSIATEAEANRPRLASSPTIAVKSTTDGADLILANDSDLDDSPLDFSIIVTFQSTELPQRDIFLAVIQALLNLGPLKSTARVRRPVVIAGDALTVRMITTFQPVIDRSMPPFLVYGDVVKGLAALPRLMLREGEWAEADVRLLVGDQLVGNGTLRSGPKRGGTADDTVDVNVAGS